MLHILWVLIKWILILLGILLGIVFLMLFLVLFCPVRYRGTARKEEGSLKEAQAEARISWLFGGVSFFIGIKNGTVSKELKIIGIPSLSLYEKWTKRKEKKKTVTEENRKMEKAPVKQETPALSAAEPILEKSEVPVSEPSGEENIYSQKEDVSEKPGKLKIIKDHIKNIIDKLKNIPSVLNKIIVIFRRFCDKIEWWKKFFEHPRTKVGVAFAKEKTWKLLKHVFPTKINGNVRFACEDPSVTGTVLAVLGMTMPLHQNRVEVMPVFEDRNFLEGKVKVKGRMYAIVPVVILLELYFNKDIKYIIRRWKHKEV